MRTATVSKLKMSLSAYLRQVKEGEEVIITEHGRPIARLLPLAMPESVTEHLRKYGNARSAHPRGETVVGGFLGPPATIGSSGSRAFSRYTGAWGRLVNFWDTSAVIPLCVQEPLSATVRDLLMCNTSMVCVVGYAHRVYFCVDATG